MRIKNERVAVNKAPVAVSVTNAGVQLAVANPERITTTIYNNGAVTIYIGRDATVTTVVGIPLVPGATMVDDSTDDIYAITAVSACDVRVMESL
jgi:hypothetical protein